MPGAAKFNNVIVPITALEFVKTLSRLLLLVGEGPDLKIFDHGTSQLLNIQRVFKTQAIHGITASRTYEADNKGFVINLLVWGCRRIRYGQICDSNNDGESDIKVDFDPEIQSDDWILDAQFEPGVRERGKIASQKRVQDNAVLATAKNIVFALLYTPEDHLSLVRITNGPKSMFYSANIHWADDGRILITSGTVFGEVLVWSFADSAMSVDAIFPAATHLHYRLTGHEGSVFGVRISPRLSGPIFGEAKRLLASCSDDRTIRVWDISDLEAEDVLAEADTAVNGFSDAYMDDERSASSGVCVATVMGHLSRIWDVRFLLSQECVYVLSFGEDSTTQLWQLGGKSTGHKSSRSGEPDSRQLIHRQTYAYHSGKNIWASAVLPQQDDVHTVCTGGADGQVVSYDIPQGGNVLATKSTMQDAANQLDGHETMTVDVSKNQSADVKTTLGERVFDGLVGAWSIKRDIRSALSSYPSGYFFGEAVFEQRQSEAQEIDKEYLYKENGTFQANDGPRFAATRQYVYRYQRSDDTIRAWFVKPDDHTTADYLFHELRLESPTKDSHLQGNCVLNAHSYHLCVQDHYSSEYQFCLKDAVLGNWRLVHRVNGPYKDYVMDAFYARWSDPFEESPAKIKDKNASAVRQVMGKKERYLSGHGFYNDGFKNYVSLDHDSFLATTAQGRLLLGSFASSGGGERIRRHSNSSTSSLEWELISQFDSLRSSSVIVKAVDSDLVLMSGSDSRIFTYRSPEKRVRYAVDLERKIAFLHAQKLQTRVADAADHIVLTTCLGLSITYVYMAGPISTGSEVDFQEQPLLLAFPEAFIVTSACYIEEMEIWILGSRNGALACYDFSRLSPNAITKTCNVLTGLHGQDAITVILALPVRMNTHRPSKYVLTAGRDGNYAVHLITTNRNTSRKCKITVVTVHHSTPPFGPNIEGAAFDHETFDLLLWGFRSKHFVVWNASRNMETMAIECGGAHRNWDFTPRSDGSDGGTFVWTKTSVCHVHSQMRVSHRLFQAGGHGREIKAIDVSPMIKGADGSELQYIATGAEDTAIRIWSYHNEHDLQTGFKCLATLTKHTTGIQQLRWSNDAGLLFSAAGREEFFVWRIQPVPLLGIGVMCEAVCPAVSEDGDLRIMDFAFEEIDADDYTQPRSRWNYFVTIVYSDSSLRVTHPLTSIVHIMLTQYLSDVPLHFQSYPTYLQTHPIRQL